MAQEAVVVGSKEESQPIRSGAVKVVSQITLKGETDGV